jgi:hypothetical protein
MRLILAALVLAGALILAPALARDDGQWEGVPPEIRQWYRSARLTLAAQARFPFKSCCDHADVVKTKFKVNKVDGRDEWWWWEYGRWRRVPDDVIHWGEHAPDRKPTLFLYGGEETCFFPGDGGI